MVKTAPYKGVPVSFIDRGKGRTVVLIHGFLGSSEIWDSTIDFLSKHFRVIAIDLPGHGKTECIGYVHTMEMYAKCIKTVMDSLKLKKYVLVGHSMGGYAAIAFAELFADNLKGLCLFHSTAFADSDERKQNRTRAIFAVKQNHNLYIRNTIKNLFATKYHKLLLEEITFAQKTAKACSNRSIAASLEGMKDRVNRDIVFNFIDCPKLIIAGGLDNVLDYESLETLAKHSRNTTFLGLPQVGHMGFLESPKFCNQELAKFLKKCFLGAKSSH